MAADKSAFTFWRVCIIDDASTDDSLQNIENLDLPIQIIRNTTRRGYGASCNLGAKRSKADYLLFLNTDTRLTFNSLSKPLLYMEQIENKQVAIAGIKLLEDSDKVSRSCARFPKVSTFFVTMFGLNRLFPSIFLSHQMKEWNHLNTREVDQVMGAFMLMRSSVFLKLGGYDERFFVYMEDLDLSLRTRQLGLKSIYLSDSYAYHIGGGTSDKVKDESLFFNLRSRIQYGFKHFSLIGSVTLVVGTILIEPMTRLALGFLHRSIVEVKTTIQAYIKLWRWCLSLIHSGFLLQKD